MCPPDSIHITTGNGRGTKSLVINKAAVSPVLQFRLKSRAKGKTVQHTPEQATQQLRKSDVTGDAKRDTSVPCGKRNSKTELV